MGKKENPVQNACLEYLALNHIESWRNNSGAIKIQNRFIRYGKKGSSDILGICPDGRFLAVECKAPKNGKLTADQKEFLDCINRNGGIGIVVNSIDSLEKQLKEAQVL